jgi:hypothetical protein
MKRAPAAAEARPLADKQFEKCKNRARAQRRKAPKKM